MNLLRSITLSLLAGSALFATNFALVNTGITAGSGCIGTVALPTGCTLGAQAATGIQGWTIALVPSGSTTPTSITVGGGPPVNTTNPWLTDNTTSTWLRPRNGTAPAFGVDNDPLGNYQWRLSFTLTAQEAADANSTLPGRGGRITGRYASDDVGFLHFNGVGIAANGTGANQDVAGLQTFQTWTPFTISSGFVAGVNTIQLNVTNVSTGFTGAKTASGIRVEFSQASILPEGGEFAGLTLGLGLVLFGWNRKRSALGLA